MINGESKFLNLDGFKMHYEVYEGLVDQDMLLIHGNLASTLWWHPMIEELQKRKNIKSESSQSSSTSSPAVKQQSSSTSSPAVKQQSSSTSSPAVGKGRLIATDWRGFGKSKGLKSEDDISFDVFADDHLHLIESEKLENLAVVGHSTGGLIAMKAILKQPHKFKNLVLLDSIGPLGIETPIPLDQLLGHFDAMSKNEELSNMTIAATIENVDVTTDYFKALAKMTFETDPVAWQGVPKKLCTEIDITDQMKDLNLPTLILHGEKDMVLPIEGSKKMSTMIKNSELKIIKNHGHSLNVEDPKKLLDLIQNFLG